MNYMKRLINESTISSSFSIVASVSDYLCISYW